MASVQLVRRRTSSELSQTERMALRAEERARGHSSKLAAHALSRIKRGVYTNTDVHTLLEQLFLHPPTMVPQRYLIDSPSSKATSRSKQHRRISSALTHNRSYVRQLRCKHRSSTASHYFHVPQTPLPLSFEAQRDIDYVTGRQRCGRLQVGSGYAPLFSMLNTWTPEASTAVERRALQFLKPPERSPMVETLERLASQAHYKPSDPMARIRVNEPAHLPDLHRRAPAEFVPACSKMPTVCFAKHCEGNEDRAACSKAARKYAAWL
ncbi:hypothetical protein LSCM4_06236 [Leishmania orientalis]|uniref:Uncharacterized protein n=1 Tax=Leishmania orientalis TaxID=2249476 RepID=A0A836KM05_9TRYP|nr:hypothetical protein LSCM4_06236 [Leishmania orientalis]